MLECKICGTKFNAVIERHYLARDNLVITEKLGWQLPLALLLKNACMMHLTARCVVAR